MNGRKIGYWVTTGLGTAILTFGGINELGHTHRITETIAHLGYPAFLPSLLGTWKLLAVVALLAPRFPRLKEWAYAGIFFDLTGAILSHAVAGDGPAAFAPPVVVLALVAASWALRPADRVLAAASARPAAGASAPVLANAAG
jgi:DoxX-like family